MFATVNILNRTHFSIIVAASYMNPTRFVSIVAVIYINATLFVQFVAAIRIKGVNVIVNVAAFYINLAGIALSTRLIAGQWLLSNLWYLCFFIVQVEIR